jgi:hypothetical protein
MDTHLDPASLAIQLFGGIRPLARAVKRDPAAIMRWRRHGRIPATSHIDLLQAAQAAGIVLTPEDVIYGRAID